MFLLFFPITGLPEPRTHNPLIFALHQSTENQFAKSPCVKRLSQGGLDSKESNCNSGVPVQFFSQENPLEKGMSTNSSILTWRIPWTEEPDGL